jgi:hypothetical protein
LTFSLEQHTLLVLVWTKFFTEFEMQAVHYKDKQ